MTARRFWFLLRGRAGFSVWKSFPDDGREKKKRKEDAITCEWPV